MPYTMPAPTTIVDAGALFWAPLGTTIPGSGAGGVVAGSVFTDSWASPWVLLGPTEDGTDFTYDLKVEPITVAEFYDPVKYVTTSRSGSLAFNLASYTLSNLNKALNGGALTIVSGTGATQLNKLSPPVVGQEVRCMLGWESLDHTARIIAYQTINGGSLKTSFKKGPKIGVISTQFSFEIPTSGNPFDIFTAGTTRA